MPWTSEHTKWLVDTGERLKTADGKEGYVATDKVRSLLDYRLLATKVNNEWRITAFLAGD